ncbi:MAG: Two-component system sensor histidine kinase [Nitrospira sp.]|nr:MAG: Two-component system sensor histidine kinase [Nitrospira sp.]
MKRHGVFALMVAVTLMIGQLPAEAVERAEAEETARLLAKLLQSGRIVIERNQSLIDDPHKGEKGFTPDLFEQQLAQEFRLKTGIDLTSLSKTPVSTTLPPLAKELLPALVQASREVIREAQVVINQRGIGYKNFIPATYGSQASARFSRSSHVRLKQTTNQPRNPKNEPDEYEASVLQWLAGRPRAEAYVSELTEEGRTLRVVMPIYYAKDCLTCHGEPKGDLDISGYPKEGHKEGDLAGAITVTAPLTSR